jgi:hypothetical protein
VGVDKFRCDRLFLLVGGEMNMLLIIFIHLSSSKSLPAQMVSTIIKSYANTDLKDQR